MERLWLTSFTEGMQGISGSDSLGSSALIGATMARFYVVTVVFIRNRVERFDLM